MIKIKIESLMRSWNRQNHSGRNICKFMQICECVNGDKNVDFSTISEIKFLEIKNLEIKFGNWIQMNSSFLERINQKLWYISIKIQLQFGAKISEFRIGYLKKK